MAPTPKPIDWRRLRKWLEAGYTLREIAPYFELTVSAIRRRATKELPSDVSDELAYLSRVASQRKRRGKAECGTLKGYWQHYYRREMACQDCLDTFTTWRRGRRGTLPPGPTARLRYYREEDHPFRRANEQRRAAAERARAQRADREASAEDSGVLQEQDRGAPPPA